MANNSGRWGYQGWWSKTSGGWKLDPWGGGGGGHPAGGALLSEGGGSQPAGEGGGSYPAEGPAPSDAGLALEARILQAEAHGPSSAGTSITEATTEPRRMRICRHCGVYEPHQDRTEECCLKIYGTKCSFPQGGSEAAEHAGGAVQHVQRAAGTTGDGAGGGHCGVGGVIVAKRNENGFHNF